MKSGGLIFVFETPPVHSFGMPQYVASVGMEVHAELDTESKMFCRCKVAFGGEPNTRVCPVCLGLPGALPVPNHRAIEMVLRTALALNCKIAMHSIFHRKNYFYPDLPKGYQISQYEETNPIGYHGYLEINDRKGSVKKVKIRRVHLEEDTGKLMHLPGGGSGIDFNRSGVPLMEIVTEFPPDITDHEEAKEYLVQLRQLLLYLGVCNGKMEEGSLRCEPNISIRQADSEKLGTKTELKNLNSFRAVQLGVQYEIERQKNLLESGARVLQETRGWNEAEEASFPMRTKEAENDYRYFPDPDLVPMSFSELQIENLRDSIPELPLAKIMRYKKELNLPDYDAEWLAADLDMVRFFEDCIEAGAPAKATFNWMSSEFAKRLNEDGIPPQASRVTPLHLAELITLIQTGEISGKIAKQVFEEVYDTGAKPSEIVAKRGLTQVSDLSELREAVRNVLTENAAVVEKYRSGQVSVAGYLVGQVMKITQGRANPEMVQNLVKEELEA